MKKCPKCQGAGHIARFSEKAGGMCFACKGSGRVGGAPPKSKGNGKGPAKGKPQAPARKKLDGDTLWTLFCVIVFVGVLIAIFAVGAPALG